MEISLENKIKSAKGVRKCTIGSITVLLTKTLNNDMISAVVTTNMKIMLNMIILRIMELMLYILLS